MRAAKYISSGHANSRKKGSVRKGGSRGHAATAPAQPQQQQQHQQQAPPDGETQRLQRTQSMQGIWAELLPQYASTVPDTGGTPMEDATHHALTELWDEMCVPTSSRSTFLIGASDESARNEIRRLSNIYTLSMRVITLLEHREACMEVMRGVLERCSERVLNAEPGTMRREHDKYVASLTRCVQGLRRATLEFLEALQAWRKGLNVVEPFKYRGEPYVATLQADMQYLKAQKAAQTFLKAEVLQTPLLFCFGTSAGGAAGTAKHRRTQAAQDVYLQELALSTPEVETPADEALSVAHLLQCGSPDTVGRQSSVKEDKLHALAMSGFASLCSEVEGSVVDKENTEESDHSVSEASQGRTGQESTASGALTDTPIDADGLFEQDIPSPQSAQGVAPSVVEEKVQPVKPEKRNVQRGPASAARQDAAARTIQQTFRAYAGERERSRVQEDVINEVEELRRRALLLHEQRMREAQREAEEARVKEEQWQATMALRHNAARRVQQRWKSWWTVKVAQNSAREKRVQRAKEKAVQVIWQQWVSLKVRGLHRDARVDAAKRYRARRVQEAVACAHYEAALATLQRIGRAAEVRKGLLLRHTEAVQLRAQRRDILICKAARGMLARLNVRRLREGVQADLLLRREEEQRHCAVTRIQAFVRGSAARRHATYLRRCRELDVQGMLNRAARKVVKAFRIAAARNVRRRLHAEREAEETCQQVLELREAAAMKILWWYKGRTCAAATRQRLELRAERRRDHVQKVGDRYRRVMNDNDIQMPLLAEVLDNTLATMHEKEAYEESEVSDSEVNVLDTITQHAIPFTHNRRALAVFAASFSHFLSKDDVTTLGDYMLGTHQRVISGVKLPFLDLTLVTRHEEDVSHVILNNFLCHSKDTILQMLAHMYNGAAPPVKDKWTAVSILTRVIYDWGLHATVSYLAEAEVAPGAPPLLSSVLADLNMGSSEELLASLRQDPLLLLFSDKLTSETLAELGAVLPDSQDDFLTWSHEMGCLQALSTFPQDLLATAAETLRLPVLGNRDKLEQLMARHTVTFKPDI